MRFQCQYHYGALVDEEPVCIEVTHSMRSRQWQHGGLVCRECREYLRGQWRHCRAAKEHAQ